MLRALPILAASAILASACACARADELKLKDGSKVVGTIVGFEEASFRVKTSYGFAIVQKDQVVSINIAADAKRPDADPKPLVAEKPSPPKAESATSSSDSAAKTEKKEPEKKDVKSAPASTDVPKTNPPAVAASNSAPSPNIIVAKNLPPPQLAATPADNAPAAKPAAPPAPEPMREEISGNTYLNQTYGFSMYKPPDWQLIEGARAMLPGAITAMGTADQKTYLLIGEVSAGKSLANDADATEHRLRERMDNYRALGEAHISVSGSASIERKFRGSIDQHDWSGVMVCVPRGTHLYTIFAMTSAESDLVQIQENVISRAIASLQFTKN
jgi:hypothetical protein